MTTFREIRPRQTTDLDSSFSPSSSANKVEKGKKPGPHSRRHVSVACQACKDSKSKCSGNHPCQRCQSRSLECVFNKDLDGRGNALLKRRVEELEQDSELLHQLLQVIRDSQDSDLTPIISSIRNNSSLDEIRLCIQQQVAGAQTSGQLDDQGREADNQRESKSPRKQHGKTSSLFRVIDVARLVDSQPYEIPASPWTTVTNYDGLVSHLVSALFTWDKGLYNFIDERVFLRDMRKGELGSAFCSPFLVNSLLACCCPFSDYEESKTQQGVISKLMMEFIDEAKRLLEEEVRNPSLTTVQGLLYLFLAVSATSKDEIGSQYLKQAVSMCEDLSKLDSQGNMTHNSMPNEKDWSDAVDHTCWGVFNFSTTASLALVMPQSMEIPSRKKPEVSSIVAGEEDWRPYPGEGIKIASYTIELMRYHCDLTIICREATHLLFTKDAEKPVSRNILENQIFAIHDRILSWYRSLPKHLMPTSKSASAAIAHAAHYQTVILTIFGTLKISCEGASEDGVERAKKLCVEAAVEVVHICRLHQANFGSQHMAQFFVQPITLALYTLMDELENSSYYNEQVADLCLFFRVLTRRWPVGMAAFHKIQLNAKERGIRLSVGDEYNI